MAWTDLGLAVLGAAGLILVPGFGIALALGARGFTATAIAVPAGVTAIVLASLGAPVVGVDWGVVPVAIVAVVVAAIAAALRIMPWHTRDPLVAVPRLDRVQFGALLAAVIIIVIQLLAMIGDPRNISQTFDNIFHLNAIRYVLDTGSASPLTIGMMTSAPTGGLPFYPSGWHAVASLIVQVTGVSIPIASNSAMIFFAAFAWPVAALFLVRSLLGPSTIVTVTALALSVAIPAFPLLLLEYGVLFPYMMSLSMIGVPLALVIAAGRKSGWKDCWPYVVAALGSAPAVAVAHPGGFVALLVFATVILAVYLVRFLLAERSRRAKVVASASALLYIVAALGSWYFLRPAAAARTWLQTETVGQAVGEVLTASVWFAPVNVVVSVLSLIGLVAALRRRAITDWIAIGFFVAAAGLYIIVSGLPYLELRDILTGAWYNNAPRLAALLAFAWVPLGAIGGTHAWSALTGILSRLDSGPAQRAIAAVVAMIVLVMVPQFVNMRQAVVSANSSYAISDTSPLLTSDEAALIARLDHEVPADAVILGSPWTGTALAYAIADRDVVMPHTLMDITPEMSVLLDHLDSAKPGSAEVCGALDALDVEYVLDFGTQEINGGEHIYRGLDRLKRSDSVEKVDAEGEAVLYKVVLCD